MNYLSLRELGDIMDKIKLLESAILVIRNHIGHQNAIISDLRILLKEANDGIDTKNPRMNDTEVTVRAVMKHLNIPYSTVLEQMNGGDYDWGSLLKKTEEEEDD